MYTDIQYTMYGEYLRDCICALTPDELVDALSRTADKWRESGKQCQLSEYVSRHGYDHPGILTMRDFFAGPYHSPDIAGQLFDRESMEVWLREHAMTWEDLMDIHEAVYHAPLQTGPMCYVPGRY